MEKIILTKATELHELIRTEISSLADKIRSELNQKTERVLLSSKETCELLNCSPSALSKWKASGKIPFRKIGKKILFDRKEILAAIKKENEQ